MKLSVIIDNINYINLHNSLSDNKYMKVTIKSKLIGVGRLLISVNYHEF